MLRHVADSDKSQIIGFFKRRASRFMNFRPTCFNWLAVLSPRGGAWRIVPKLGSFRGAKGWVTAVVFAGLGVARAAAAVVTWDGGAGTGAWGTGTNWSTNSVPANADSLIFNAAGANNQFAITLGANRTTAGVTFASAVGVNAFTFTGNTLTVGASGIVNNDSETQTFNSAVTANAAQTWNAASGALTFNAVTLANSLTLAGANAITLGGGGGTLINSGGNRTLTNNATGAVSIGNINLSNNNTGRTLTLTGTGATSVTGVIANGGTSAGNLTKTGAGTLTLSGANTYTGATTLSAGTIVVGNNAAFGTGTVNLAAATLQGDGTPRTLANNVSLTGNGTVAGASDLGFTGTLTLTGNRTLTNNSTGAVTFGNVNLANNTTNRTLTLAGTGDTTISGVVSNNTSSASRLTKTGTGTLTLTGVNTYTGVTRINAGTLSVATIGNGGVAGNLGAATNAANRIVFAGGTLQYTGATASTNRSFTLTAATTSGIEVTGGGTNLTISGASTATTGALTKTGAGTLTLAGANLHTGLTSVNAGTLAYGANNALSSGAVTVNGGTLAIGNFTDTVGAVTLTSGAITGGAGVLTGTAYAVQAGTISAILGGAGALTKTTAGTVTLSGANTYTGATTVSAGTLQLGAAGAIADTNAVTVTTPGTFDLNGFNETIGSLAGTGSVTLGSGTLAAGANNTSTAFSGVISGTGGLTKTGAGTLTLSGTNTYTGPTTINQGTLSVGTIGNGGVAGNLGAASAAAGNLVFGGGTLQYTGATAGTDRGFTLNNGSGGTLDVVGAGANLTLSGSAANTTGALTKTGAGTLTLAGANLYSGTTTISAGTLLAQGNAALGATAGATTVSAGATLAIAGGTNLSKTGALTLTGTGTSSTTGALHAAGATGTISQWSGDLVLAGNTTVTAADNILKIGNDLTFANTINLGANTLTLNATSPTSIPLTYLFAPSYAIDPTNIYITSTISGTGGLTKTGAGALTLISFPLNTYTGDTTVLGGTMIVDGSGGSPAPGGARPVISSNNVIIGNSAGAGAADSVVLRMGQAVSGTGPNYAIGAYDGTSGVNLATTSLTVYADGILQMQGASNAFTNLTLQGGHIDQGLLAQGSLLTVTGGVTTQASSRTAVIQDGNFAMSNNAFTFNVASGTAPGGIDLRIDSIVQNGVGFTGSSANNSFTKTGAGTLQLTAANIYGGVTDVQAGVLNVSHGQALGQSLNNSIDHGTVVQAGAQLQLQGGITINNETLTLNGTGIGNTGALRNVAGDNTYRGQIKLATDARINADAGTTLALTNPSSLSGTIINGTAAGKNLTVGGAGDTIINGSLSGFVNNLTKDGTGTLTLAGSNGYVGATAVTSGALKVIHNSGLSGTGVTVSNGAALQFAQTALGADISAVGPATTISGTGLANGGAIQNLTGSNTYNGAVTLAANSRITADAGSSLTFTNTVNGAGFALNLGGAGNTTYNGAISGASTAVTKSDAGTVTFGGAAANTFTGTLTVADGTLNLNKTAGINAVGTGAVIIGDGGGAASSAHLALQADNQIQDNAILTLNADGRLALGTFVESVGSIAGTGLVDLGTSGSLTVGANGTSSSFSGSVTGTGTLEKSGAGSLTFNSDINYGGTFLLGGGTLLLNNVDLTVTNFIITANSTIDFGGGSSNIFATNLSLLNSGITVSIINWNDTIDFFFANNFAGATPDDRGGPSANQIVFSGYTGANTIWQSFDDQITPVPEPSTYGALLLGTSLGLLGYRRWRQRRVMQRPPV